MERILLVLDGDNALGDADSARLGSVDGYRKCAVQMERVEKPLHQYTLHPQQQCTENEDSNSSIQLREIEYRLIREHCSGDITYQIEYHRTGKCSSRNSLKVNERGISYNSGVGMEEFERYLEEYA